MRRVSMAQALALIALNEVESATDRMRTIHPTHPQSRGGKTGIRKAKRMAKKRRNQLRHRVACLHMKG